MNPSAKPELSIISAGLVVVGNVISTGEIQLEGKILGDVRTPGLTIGHSGRVKGDVFAEQVEVLGEIVGAVSARSVLVTSTGRVTGNLLVKNLVVEPGGHFDGYCSRADEGGCSLVTAAVNDMSIDAQAMPREAAE